MKNKYLYPFAVILFLCHTLFSQQAATFEEFNLPPNSYWNGQNSTLGTFPGNFSDSIYRFPNTYTRADYGTGLMELWSGFAISRMKNDSTGDISNQYSAITGEGANGSLAYAVFYNPGKDTIQLTKKAKLSSVQITNSTYAYFTMKNGSLFSKKFGGETGNDPDWFLLSITGIKDGVRKDTLEFYLADFRDSDNTKDTIISTWQNLDLSVLDTVDMLEISLSSSDTGLWGMNTPAYFCLDDFAGTNFDSLPVPWSNYMNGASKSYGSYPSIFTDGNARFFNVYNISEWAESWEGFAYSSMKDDTTRGFMNQYSAFPAEGANGSLTYGICYNSSGKDSIMLNSPVQLSGMYVTNSTYAYYTMKEGNSDFGIEPFGATSGNHPDWFLLTIKGLKNGQYTDSVLFYLADYRFKEDSLDYIVDQWEWVDLSSLGTVEMIEFSLSSSDMGPWGMNTPAYFCLDDLNGTAPTNLGANNILASQDYKVYPNPFSDHVSVSATRKISKIIITDLTGKICHEAVINSENHMAVTHHLQPGIYLLILQNDQGTFVEKIIKQ